MVVLLEYSSPKEKAVCHLDKLYWKDEYTAQKLADGCWGLVL